MKIHAPCLAACACLLLISCVSTQQCVPLPDQSKTVADASKGRIYVMRPTTFGGAINADVNDNGNFIGSTGPQSFLCWERAPGEAVITSKAENTSAVRVPVKAGQVRYVFQHMRMGLITARTELELVSEQEGRKVLAECKPPTVLK